MGTRLAALVVALGLLTACGSVDEQEAGEIGAVEATEELLAAPPIEAIDEPAPEGALDLVSAPIPHADDWVSDGGAGCVRVTYEVEGSAPIPEEKCPEDVVALILADEAKALPAADANPRAVARLRLEDGGTFYVVEYQSRGRGTCAFVYGEDESGLPSGGATGGMPCSLGGEQFCRELCVVPVLSAAGNRVVLAGTVSASAESIRITFDDGYVARYPLEGPTLSTDPEQRIFMVEQSHGEHSRIELLEGGEVVASEEPPPIPEDGEILPPELTQTPGTEIEVDGRMLTVAIGPEAPPEAQALLEAEQLLFLCAGSEDDLEAEEPPPSSAHGRFPPGEREVTVELDADVRGTLVMCGAGLIDGEEGVFRVFVSYDDLRDLAPDTIYDQDPAARFSLDGRRLTVAIGPDAAPETELLLDRDLRFACGTEDKFGPYGPTALAEGRFPPGKREVTVTLSADPGVDVFFCGVEAKDGSTEAFSFDVGGSR